MHKKTDSIIFDMDGTLWDAVPAYTKAWNKYNRSVKYPDVRPEFLRSLMGLEEKLFLAKIIPHISEIDRSSVYAGQIIPLIYQVVEREGGRLYEGVDEGIKRLSEKYRLFIVSNCPEKLIDCFIRWGGFESYITDSVAHGQNFKSKSENILLLKEKHQLICPAYVGDTDADRMQAEKAKVPFFYVDYGFGACSEYTQRFSAFNELVSFLTQNDRH